MRSRGDFVGMFEEGNLVWRLCHAGLVNGRLQVDEVGLVKGEEGDVRGDLVFDRPYFGFAEVFGGQMGVDSVSGQNFIDFISVLISML